MLYLFHGTDISKSAAKTRSLIDSLRAKRPDAAFVHVDADHWSSAAVEENLGGQGLFSNKYIVFLDRISESDEALEILPAMAPQMNESSNIFIVLEGKLNADWKKTLTSAAAKSVTSDLQSSGDKRSDFNVFALADALGTRKGLAAWALFRQAIVHHIEPENILGTLFWQAKSMVVAQRSASAASSGLSPFVYGKSKKHAANYSPEELRHMLGDLVSIYHEGHRGLDAELALEAWLLRLND